MPRTTEAKFRAARYRMQLIRQTAEHFHIQQVRTRSSPNIRTMLRLDRLQERRWMRT